MILSVTCRHGTDANINRSSIRRELLDLARYEPSITRSNAVFTKERHHRQGEDLVTCHLSIHMAGRPQVDIYEQQNSEWQAFHRAMERVVRRLSGGGATAGHCRGVAAFS